VFDELVVLRGGGDLGTGAAARLWRAGFRVVILETPHPVAVRRTVSLSEAVYAGSHSVEEVTAVLVGSIDEAGPTLDGGRVPVLIDAEGVSIPRLRPVAVVDAILAKQNTGTRLSMAPLVIGLGPGFSAGEDVHAVLETNRGPNLGRVIWHGSAEANTGEPAPMEGRARSRVFRAPRSGPLHTYHSIGEIVEEGTPVAAVNGEPVCAGFKGTLRGLLRDGSEVRTGMKIGDLDPRLDPMLCRRISDKSLAIAGGVLEAVIGRLHGRLS
jgi:xanthine dehydrogenase accessory factor